MSSPVWQMKDQDSLAFGMWPPMLPTFALMMDSVIFMSADLLIGSGFELF